MSLVALLRHLHTDLRIFAGKIPPFAGGLQFVRGFFCDPNVAVVELLHVLFSDEFLASPAPESARSLHPTMKEYCLAKQIARGRKFGKPAGQAQQIAAVATHSVSDERLKQIRKARIPCMVIGAGGDKVLGN